MTTESVGPEKTQSGPLPSLSHEQLLSRFASVWLWTIFFGLNGGLTASLMSASTTAMNPLVWEMMARQYGMAGRPQNAATEFITVATPFLYVSGIILNVISWGFLYIYFSFYLIPTVIQLQPVRSEDARSKFAAWTLRWTYLCVIAGGLLRFLPELMMHIIPALTSMGVG